MKLFIIFFSVVIVLFSCASGEDYATDKSQYYTPRRCEIEDLNKDYNFYEGYIKTPNESSLYYNFWYKKQSKGLIVLTHNKDNTLVEWNILLDFFQEQGFSVISYDLRGHGESISKSYDKLSEHFSDDLKLIVDFAQKKYEKFSKIIFIGDGLGANITLQASKNFCSINSSFVMLSTSINNKEIPLETFKDFCPNSKYLFLYSQKSFIDVKKENYIYDNELIHTKIDLVSDYMGINLLIHNSFFLKEVKNIMKF